MAGPAHIDSEPELAWSAIVEGRTFAEVPIELDDGAIDSYLAAAGEWHPLYERRVGRLAPPMYTTLVRFAKASLGGRWPSGTIQLDHRIAFFRPFHRGERLTIDVRIRTAEARNGRSYFETVSVMRDRDRRVVGEQSATSMWAGAVPAGMPIDSGRSPARTAPAARDPAPPAPAAAQEHEETARIGPIAAQFTLQSLRDFGRVAGALDPIHVDPDFARATRYGANVVQGRLAMTLLARLMLDHWGRDWLHGGELSVRFRKPLFVDQRVWAWGAPVGDGKHDFAVWCENEHGEKVVEGSARIGAMSPSADVPDPQGAGNR